jgi:hypothetical protein
MQSMRRRKYSYCKSRRTVYDILHEVRHYLHQSTLEYFFTGPIVKRGIVSKYSFTFLFAPIPRIKITFIPMLVYLFTSQHILTLINGQTSNYNFQQCALGSDEAQSVATTNTWLH